MGWANRRDFCQPPKLTRLKQYASPASGSSANANCSSPTQLTSFCSSWHIPCRRSRLPYSRSNYSKPAEREACYCQGVWSSFLQSMAWAVSWLLLSTVRIHRLQNLTVVHAQTWYVHNNKCLYASLTCSTFSYFAGRSVSASTLPPRRYWWLFR